jgi:hypothetical protein
MTEKDLRKLGLIPNKQAYKDMMILTKYLYIFCAGILFGILIGLN